MDQLPEGKNAVIYGAGGRTGGGIARTFAHKAAAVFLVRADSDFPAIRIAVAHGSVTISCLRWSA